MVQLSTIINDKMIFFMAYSSIIRHELKESAYSTSS